MGFRPKVLDGDGNAMREARRALFLDVILPLSAVVSQELSLKLDSNITLDFGPSQFRDAQRLSRSLKTFIEAGLSLSQAAALLGINLSEGTPPPTGTGGQAAAVEQQTNNEVNQQGTPTNTPPNTPSNARNDLMIKHLHDGRVVLEHGSNEPCELCRERGAERGAERGSSNGHIVREMK